MFVWLHELHGMLDFAHQAMFLELSTLFLLFNRHFLTKQIVKTLNILVVPVDLKL